MCGACAIGIPRRHLHCDCCGERENWSVRGRGYYVSCVLSSNYTFYGDMQRRVIAACEPFARYFEIYSIDATFLDLAGFEDRDLVDHARAMREHVHLWTTIPSCVGIAETLCLKPSSHGLCSRRIRRNATA